MCIRDSYRRAFEQHALHGLLFPTVPVPTPLAAPEASSLDSFLRLARNVDQMCIRDSRTVADLLNQEAAQAEGEPQ